MTNEELLREIVALPPEGLNLLENFLGVMRQRDTRQNSPKPSTPLLSEKFIGMWRGRDEMSDSATRVRNLRKSEWAQ